MLDDTQLGRLAAAANAIRPAWSTKSLTTFLQAHRSRTYRDLAVALAYIAADRSVQTPGKLNDSGPWWQAAGAEDSEGFERFRVRCPVHPARKAGTCPDCAAAATPPNPVIVARLRATLAGWSRPTRSDITHPRKATR